VSLYTVGWFLWIGFFIIEEGLALARGGPGSTLSEHVWKWFAIPDRNSTKPEPVKVTWKVRARRFALLAGMAWLALHFLTGGRF